MEVNLIGVVQLTLRSSVVFAQLAMEHPHILLLGSSQNMSEHRLLDLPPTVR